MINDLPIKPASQETLLIVPVETLPPEQAQARGLIDFLQQLVGEKVITISRFETTKQRLLEILFGTPNS